MIITMSHVALHNPTPGEFQSDRYSFYTLSQNEMPYDSSGR